MPRTRAYRRHKRRVKLARRHRIVKHSASWAFSGPFPIPPQVMHWHFRCGCFDHRETTLRRRREEREWRRREIT